MMASYCRKKKLKSKIAQNNCLLLCTVCFMVTKQKLSNYPDILSVIVNWKCLHALEGGGGSGGSGKLKTWLMQVSCSCSLEISYCNSVFFVVGVFCCCCWDFLCLNECLNTKYNCLLDYYCSCCHFLFYLHSKDKVPDPQLLQICTAQQSLINCANLPFSKRVYKKQFLAQICKVRHIKIRYKLSIEYI